MRSRGGAPLGSERLHADKCNRRPEFGLRIATHLANDYETRMMNSRETIILLELTLERAMDHRPSVELLESTHSFPGDYKIKAIGEADDDFESRIIEAVYSHLPARSDLDYSVRSTPGGRHIAITLDMTVQTAEQVRAIYAEIQLVKGLTHLF